MENINILLLVHAESKPKSVHLWHANTFWNNRRDFRIVNLDDPCLSGPVVDDLCTNLFAVWTAEVCENFYFATNDLKRIVIAN